MKIISIVAGPIATNCYLLFYEGNRDAVLIDAPLDCTQQIIDELKKNNLNLKSILLTHSHWDHAGDVKHLSEYTKAQIFVHQDDNYRLTEPDKHTVFPLLDSIEPFKEAIFFIKNQKIKTGDIELEVLFTPGHTEGGVCFVSHKEKLIFSGDTLFCQSIGRTDLPGGSLDLLMESISRELLVLPDEYKVFTGHGEETTIKFEREENPYLNGFYGIM
ncbi:MAG: MBL fold metallo-hydrolase [Bacteroidota bacterium]